MRKLSYSLRYTLLEAVKVDGTERSFPKITGSVHAPNYYLKISRPHEGAIYVYGFVPSRTQEQKRHHKKHLPYEFKEAAGGLIWVGDDIFAASGMMLEPHLAWDGQTLYVDVQIDLFSLDPSTGTHGNTGNANKSPNPWGYEWQVAHGGKGVQKGDVVK